MIVFDQDAVGKVEAVVVAPSHAHGILVQVTMTRSSLAGVHDAGLAAFDGLDVLVGIAGDAAHPLQEVQSDPLGPQDTAGVAFYPRQIGSWSEGGAVGQQHLGVQAGIDALEDGLAYFYPGQHPISFGSNHADGLDSLGDQGMGGRVVESLVFRQRSVDQVVDFRGQLTHGVFSYRNNSKLMVE